jgi:hypothetical protein
MKLTVRGVMVDVDVLEASDGRGWTFSRGNFETGPGSALKVSLVLVAGPARFYPTKEIATAAAKQWAESVIEQGRN